MLNIRKYDSEDKNLKINVIKNERQYKNYREEIERLAILDPKLGTTDGDLLELLSVLVEQYEKERYNISPPSPIDAIIFRMEEQGLRQKDLVQFIGSKSKVSEVLSGKRRLTLNMIRSLCDGLSMPAKVLITDSNSKSDGLGEDNWEKYPIKEMDKRGWFNQVKSSVKQDLVEAIKGFYEQVGGEGVGHAYFRRNLHMGGNLKFDGYALDAWLARVLVKSRDHRHNIASFQAIENPRSLLTEVAKLSRFESGPLLAREFLSERGIVLVTETHLPKTYIDGAALKDIDGTPIIGLSLRHDRLDNFWFTLLHEVAHVLLHLKSSTEAYLDNTDGDPEGSQKEVEANRYARDALIPKSIWRRTEAYREQTSKSVQDTAHELNIHPAIIAGRIRRETNNYKKLSKLVGHREVRKLFE